MTDMVYVAEDRNQPGAAYAICVDQPQWASDTAKTIAEWAKEGAIVKHCTRAEGLAMLNKWVRPAKNGGQHELL